MFIRYFLELQLPFGEVERPLLAAPASWLPGMATEAEHQGERLLIEVGFELGVDRRIDREVQIEVGEPVSVPSTTTKLPITWKAKHGARAFPAARWRHRDRSTRNRAHTTVDERSLPSPLGMIGRALDRALMHRVAEATVKDFLDRVGERLALRSGARR